MRKISFVLLFIALMCISGCGSESPTPEDSHSAYGDMASSEERNDTEEIFKTESSEQSAVQTEAAEADELTTYAPEKNETVSSEQAAEESKNNQTKKPTSHVSENSTSDTKPVETKPAMLRRKSWTASPWPWSRRRRSRMRLPSVSWGWRCSPALSWRCC